MTNSNPTVVGLLLAVAVTLSGCTWISGDEDIAELVVETPDGVTYESEIRGVTDPDLAAQLRKNLRLFSQSERPPASLARLRRRADADQESAARVLRSEGYFAGKALVKLAPNLSTAKLPATVVVDVTAGRQFTLSGVNIIAVAADGSSLTPPPVSPPFGVLQLEPNNPARAAAIMAAEQLAVVWYRDNGFPHARYLSRRAVADLNAHSIAVTTKVMVGPEAVFGTLEITGAEGVDVEYLQSYQPWREGERYRRSKLDQLQRDLAATGLFEVVKVAPAQDVESSGGATPAPAPVPVQVTVTEAKHRSVGGGLRFSTHEGVAARAFLEHRNLFRANETLRLSGNFGLDLQEVSLLGRKPQFLVDRQALLLGLTGRIERDEAFNERSVELTAGLERNWSERLTVNGGVSLSYADFDGAAGNGRSWLLGAPFGLRYNATASVLDPVNGYRLRANLTPFAGTFDGSSVSFMVTDVSGSAYWSLDAAHRYVLAGRARLASAFGAGRDRIPPAERLYAGGGGSVRGYESRFVGPLDGNGDPLGGRSAAELGLELRTRISENIGLVPFLEAGAVSESVVPDLDASVQYGAGLGLRYYTAVGPLRGDLAFPLNKRSSDDAFQFYISIGQAF
jgi:translocation and assembly module TamA